MRPDVLEVMADELVARAAPPIASFLIVEDGRPRLAGVRTGKRWDIDREQDWNERAHERKVQVEIRRLMKMRARHRNPELYRAWHRAYEAANKQRRAEQRRARWWKNRDKMIAKGRAQYAKHREKRRAESLAYYYAHRDREMARMRAYNDNARPKEGKRHCSVCGQTGHNRMRHRR